MFRNLIKLAKPKRRSGPTSPPFMSGSTMTQASLIEVEVNHAEVAGELVRRAKSAAADLSDGERGELITRAQERSVGQFRSRQRLRGSHGVEGDKTKPAGLAATNAERRITAQASEGSYG
jgi:hypothetical protein